MSIFRTKPVLFSFRNAHQDRLVRFDFYGATSATYLLYKTILNTFLQVCFAEIVGSWVMFIVFPSSACLFHQCSQWEEESKFCGSCSWTSRSKRYGQVGNKVKKESEWTVAVTHDITFAAAGLDGIREEMQKKQCLSSCFIIWQVLLLGQTIHTELTLCPRLGGT